MINLESIGEPQFVQASGTGAGQNAITVDVINGPTRAGDYWTVDSACLYYSSGADPGFTLLPSGICIVPIGTPAVTDAVGIMDIADRGVMIATGASGVATDMNEVSSGASVYADFRTSRVNSIVPYGYTLRGVWANDPGTPANFPRGTLTLFAIVRRLRCYEADQIAGASQQAAPGARALRIG